MDCGLSISNETLGEMESFPGIEEEDRSRTRPLKRNPLTIRRKAEEDASD
jgi:hypothetical protein